MDRNTIIGFILIFAVLVIWNQFVFEPGIKESKRNTELQDSIATTQTREAIPEPTKDTAQEQNKISDTSLVKVAEEKTYFLKNNLMQISFNSKGGMIKEVLLHKFKKLKENEQGEEILLDLKLMEDPRNIFEFQIPSAKGIYSTKSAHFDVEQKNDLELSLVTTLPDGNKFFQSYKLSSDNYILEHNVKLEGSPTNSVVLNWENYMDRIEKNTEYEKYYSTVYFNEKDNDTDYCSCRSDDKIELSGKTVSWVSHAHQFFNSSLISEKGFKNAIVETVMLPDNSEDMKIGKSRMEIPADELVGKDYNMKWYIGPNEYQRLQSVHSSLDDVISYGWSVFGTINRYAIRPLFEMLSGFIGNKGIIILMLTLVVKLLVFPLSYKMLQSQAKMMVLKPEIDKIKAKNKDDMQQQQMETMKVYNEFGVNPLGGCFPLLLQMPIWIALYRFFPATIDFRQVSFLWATDLTSYDEFIKLPFSIPLFQDSLSLFAFLWMISTLIFTYYSSKSMDFSAQPAMKYMQYAMPVIFWFMFNRTAAGLTCYMFFSNLLNIAQTIVGKNYLFNQNLLREKLEKNKSKPKKQGGFQDRLQQMMKEQQKTQAERLKNKK
ncbi:MAG: membrane protein insertase YidC [Bacteroidota bacterium]|nr:membrane protein insertase YidC [Bacteroidota bacterium]